VAYDAAFPADPNRTTTPVSITLVGTDAGVATVEVAITAPGWTKDPARRFPVTIDPSYWASSPAGGILDTNV